MAETYCLASCEELDIEKTFECGQCFRWNRDEKGVYSGVACGYPAFLWNSEGRVYIRTEAPLSLWRSYFDLERDYKCISEGFNGGDYLQRCIEYGQGIRILRQEPWEALCSFIISQCNNISRIKGIVERLCESFGEETELEGRRFYRFPTAETVAALSEEALSVLRCGYRAPYILSAAIAVASGELELDKLINCDCATARAELIKQKGIGAKVANCVILFGLYHMEAFPIDVWIKRVLKEHFPKDFDPASLGEYAGLAQQYLFYYARSEGNRDNNGAERA